MVRNRFIIKLLILFVLPGISISGWSLSADARTPFPGAKPVDVEAVVDSAMILADDYAYAVINNPEMAKTRLGALRRFYDKYSQHSVQDSICDHIFSIYVDNIERDNTHRANIFKECFLAFADKDNRHLGPLYANELAIAKENFDTTEVNRMVSLLSDYASRLDFNYDEEIATAQNFVKKIRNRKPIDKAIAGVWVMDDICCDTLPDIYLNSMKVLQIRDTTNPIYDQGYGSTWCSLDSATQKSKGVERTIDIIKSDGYVEDYNFFGSHNYYPIEAWELEGFNMKPLTEEYVGKTSINKASKTGYGYPSKRYSRMTKVDNNAYAIYAFWGDERLKRNNAEVTSMLRRNVQQIQAQVAGELSRSSYKFSDRLAGNLTAGFTAGLINGLIDIAAVSKETIWCIELTLEMINPYCLVGDIYVEEITVKSDSSKPTEIRQHHRATYYRWEPEDDVCFLTPQYIRHDPAYTPGGPIILHNLSKDDDKLVDKRTNEYKKQWKEKYKQKKNEIKNNLKNVEKGTPQYDKAKEIHDRFNKFPPHVFMDFNREQLCKLKAKSDNYKP